LDFLSLARALENSSEQASEKKAVYVDYDSVFDFTDKNFSGTMNIHSPGNSITTFQVTPETLPTIFSMLKLSVFTKENKILAWDWKPFVSYALAVTGKPFEVESAIIDLKLIENYLGRRLDAPKTFSEAMNRLTRLITGGEWNDIKSIYNRIHKPLMTEVIPRIETTGVLDLETKEKVFAHYEIEGQENGRLKSIGIFQKKFLPHNLTQEKKNSIKPLSLESLFLLFDYKAYEVNFLAWLSQDPELIKICLGSEDIYSVLYKKIIGDEKIDREKCKKIFLPVIYGMSASALADRLKIAEASANSITDRIKESFSTAFAWIINYQNQAQEHGFVKDILGRKRFFDQGQYYLARNFAIQAPAATFCLEKLIQLQMAIKNTSSVVYHCHDGYALYATKDNWKKVYKIGLEILTSESDLIPGLKLQVSCKGGRNLNDLKNISRK
jgi:hypothetical protein